MTIKTKTMLINYNNVQSIDFDLKSKYIRFTFSDGCYSVFFESSSKFKEVINKIEISIDLGHTMCDISSLEIIDKKLDT